jgi:hypothetical protein
MKLTLFRLTITAWSAWLFTLVAMIWLSYARVMHPSFLYIAIPLAVCVISSLVVFCGGIWRVIRGQTRLKYLNITLFGILPTLWMAAYIQYLYDFACGRNHRPNFLLKPAYSMTSLLAEPFVRIRYPCRHEGERFVMWSDSPEKDEKKMAAMDKHIQALEKSLGEKSDYKVYWIRGPVWGVGGRYGFGWSLGSESNSPADVGDDLNYIDRHEVAHFVLDQLLPCDNDVPSVFLEGWAEFNSGKRIETTYKTSWLANRDGELFSLRKLTSPQWYHSAETPMYIQGSVLVDYILRQFGHKKFLELCKTCTEATFAEDVQRVFGLSLDELDKAFKADLAKQDSPDKRFLISQKLADGVDPAEWRQFVDDYCAGVKRFRKQFRQCNIKVFEKLDSQPKAKKGYSVKTQHEYFFDNRNRAYFRKQTDGQYATIRTHDIAFDIIMKGKDKPWELLFAMVKDEDDLFMPFKTQQLRFLELPLILTNESDNTIIGIKNSENNAQYTRVLYEDTSIRDGKTYADRGWWDFDPKLDYGLVESMRTIHSLEPNKLISQSHIKIDYVSIAGKNVPKIARSEMVGEKTMTTWTIETESCEFGPPSPKVFEPLTYGDFHPTKSIDKETFRIGILTWIAGVFTVLGLLSAFSLFLLSRMRVALLFKTKKYHEG